MPLANIERLFDVRTYVRTPPSPHPFIQLPTYCVSNEKAKSLKAIKHIKESKRHFKSYKSSFKSFLLKGSKVKALFKNSGRPHPQLRVNRFEADFRRFILR